MDAENARHLISDRIKESIALKQVLLEDSLYLSTLIEVGFAMARALRSKHKILFFGNGGSAADAQHLAAELNGRFMKERSGLAGLALTCNTSLLTAIANDYSFDRIFSRQIEGLGQSGDVAFAISTSGNSKNVLCAVEAARQLDIVTVGLIGDGGGTIGKAVQHCITIPSKSTPRVQEAHILTGHILCEILEEELFGNG
jgi:D-sedoheptulose 7-phosphate isomerase